MTFDHLDDDELIDLIDELWNAGDMYEHDRAIAEAIRRKMMEA